jgi:phospholipid/cholesterol/gamma-HCH transport system substrate-binding protein
MRRILAIAAIVVAVAAVAFVLTQSGNDSGGYKVRAIFDNAGFVIPGEDVKVAGAKVGTIDSLAVTPDYKAAVVLNITDPGFQDFRQDAGCLVRPQGLIGERFVECTLTQPRSPGQSPPPPLRKIASGPGKGQYLLSVSHNSTAVDLDLIGNIMREPVRQRLSLILNELGTGLAGRGSDLNEVIRRADPALKAVDNLLQVLSTQNRQLESLAVNSDTILQPLAAERRHVGNALANSAKVATATASRSAALQQDLQKFPPFLNQLRPTLSDLGGLADQMTPVLTDLHAQAPNINRVIQELGPFSTAALTAIGEPGEPASADTLSEVARIGTPAMKAALPTVTDLKQTAVQLKPVAKTAAALLKSFQRNQGIQRAMDYIFYQATAINGMDGIGHYLRAALIVNQCAGYATTPVGGCSAHFPDASAASATAAGASPGLVRSAAALRRMLRDEAARAKTNAKANTGSKPAPAATATPPAAAPTPMPTPAPANTDSRDATLLNYLFGSDN